MKEIVCPKCKELKPHHAKGMCENCYQLAKYHEKYATMTDEEKHERYLKQKKWVDVWQEKNKKNIKEYYKEYYKKNRDKPYYNPPKKTENYCKECGKDIIKLGGRRVYCEPCRVEIKKQKQREYNKRFNEKKKRENRK